LEIYSEKYASKENEDIDIEYNSSEEDLVSHITTRQDSNLNELEMFLKTKHAPALENILDWWKVSLILNFKLFLLKLLNYFFIATFKRISVYC
jgi:hypothetical protein